MSSWKKDDIIILVIGLAVLYLGGHFVWACLTGRL